MTQRNLEDSVEVAFKELNDAIQEVYEVRPLYPGMEEARAHLWLMRLHRHYFAESSRLLNAVKDKK